MVFREFFLPPLALQTFQCSLLQILYDLSLKVVVAKWFTLMGIRRLTANHA